MCFGRRSSPAPTPMSTPAPIMGRNPDLARESRLPDKKKLVNEDEVTGVEYGSSAKQGGAAAAKKVGTDALRIPINEGASSGSETGGINV